MKMNIKEPVVVVGLGLSGQAALRALKHLNITQVYIYDDKSDLADFNTPDALLQKVSPQTLVVSPGVSLRTPWIEKLKNSGVFITSELAIAYSLLSTEKIVAITGSIGKSTTTSLIEAGMKTAFSSYFAGGNLGTPLATYICDVLENKRKPAAWLALELSSYQLENCGDFKCDYSILTYLSANHLERYDSIEHYYSFKLKLIGLTKKACIANSFGGDLKQSLSAFKSQIPIYWTIKSVCEMKLIGEHNKDNMAMVLKFFELAHWPPAATQGACEFKGLPHRLENLGIKKEILFVNDSKATSMDSVLTAASGILPATQGTLHLLLGGKDKNLPWEQLQILKNQKNIEFIFFGQCAQLAKTKSGLVGPIFSNLKNAVEFISKNSQPKDTVLLSPGGTSLDEFKNFEDRGEKFKSYIQNFFSP